MRTLSNPTPPLRCERSNDTSRSAGWRHKTPYAVYTTNAHPKRVFARSWERIVVPHNLHKYVAYSMRRRLYTRTPTAAYAKCIHNLATMHRTPSSSPSSSSKSIRHCHSARKDYAEHKPNRVGGSRLQSEYRTQHFHSENQRVILTEWD